MKDEIVTVEWLNNNLTKDEIVILDSSPKKTVKGMVSPLSYLSIPNSRIFNIKEEFIDSKSKFPNTVPSPFQFEETCKSIGISRNSTIVVYDNLGVYSSPRLWWLFKIMGHDKVSVLNGGLIEWVNKGFKTVNKSDLKQDHIGGDFKSNFYEEHLIKYDVVIDNIETKKFLLVDARSEERFLGTELEPRKHIRSGNIPGSINIPYSTLLQNGKFKSKQVLNKIFSKKIDAGSKLVFYCGSGMTACIVLLGCEVAFQKSKYLYDGSWTEYAEINNLIESL